MSIYNLLNSSLEELEEEVITEDDANEVVESAVDYEETPEAAAEYLEEVDNEVDEESLKLEALSATEEELSGLEDSLESMLAAGKGLDAHTHRLMRTHLSAIEQRLGVAIPLPSNESFESATLSLQATEDSLESIRDVLGKVGTGIKKTITNIGLKLKDFFKWVTSTVVRLESRFKGLVKSANQRDDGDVDVPETITVPRSKNLYIGGELDPKGVLSFINDYVAEINKRTPERLKLSTDSVDSLLNTIDDLEKDEVIPKKAVEEFIEKVVHLRGTYKPHPKGNKKFIYDVTELPGNRQLLRGIDQSFSPAISKGELAASATLATIATMATGSPIVGGLAVASVFTMAVESTFKTLLRTDVRLVPNDTKAEAKNDIKPLSPKEVGDLAKGAIESLKIFSLTDGMVDIVLEENSKLNKALGKHRESFYDKIGDRTAGDAKVIHANLISIENGVLRYGIGELQAARIANKAALDGLRALSVYAARSLKAYGKVGKEIEDATKDDIKDHND